MKNGLLGLLLLALLLAVGCKKNSTPAPQQITIGALLSLSGNGSSLGLTSQKAISLAITDVNNYMELTGANFRFVSEVYDTKLDPAIALQGMNEMAAKQTRYIIGPQTSSELTAIKPVADSKNMLVVSQASTASSLAIANDGIFRFCPGDVVEGAAIANSMYSEGKRVVVTLSRDDVGNKGLQNSVGIAFSGLGGQVDAIPAYATTLTNYSALLATLKTKLQTYISTQGANNVAVYLASFEEAVVLFRQAAPDPLFASVKWYGGDGVVLSAALPADATAAAFAAATKFIAPNFGLPALQHPDFTRVNTAIKTTTGIEAEAYTMAAYDAVWVLANTVLATSNVSSDYTKIKSAFQSEAGKHFGITGPLLLNTAGDRSTGSFDYWGIVLEAGIYKWKLVGKSL
jgi:branched-chain amino acid transport system substrate-binding protein